MALVLPYTPLKGSPSFTGLGSPLRLIVYNEYPVTVELGLMALIVAQLIALRALWAESEEGRWMKEKLPVVLNKLDEMTF